MSDALVQARKERDNAQAGFKAQQAKVETVLKDLGKSEKLVAELQAERKADLEKIRQVASAESRASAAEHSARDMERKLTVERQKKAGMDVKLKKRLATAESEVVRLLNDLKHHEGTIGDEVGACPGCADRALAIDELTVSRDACRDNVAKAQRETAAVVIQRNAARQERDTAHKVCKMNDATIARLKKEHAEALKETVVSTDKGT